MSKNLVAIALEWLKLHTSLKAIKAAEAEKRAELVAACFPFGLGFGVNRAELPRGYVVKATIDKRPKINVEKLNPAINLFVLKFGDVGKLVLARLLKWTPEVRVGEWEKLTAEERVLLAGAISIEKASPSVELVEPS